MKSTFLAGLALIAAGCASHPKPTDQVASSLAAVRGAEEAGARDVPEAALHVQLAEEQIEQAKRAMDKDDNQRAEDLALRAFQDAELALALAREQQSKQRLAHFSQNNESSGGEQPVNPTPAPVAPAPPVR